MADLLEPLISVIETIKERISAHGPSLRQNETRTRAALIDPLLQALGWDSTDPALVTPEYRVDVGWADYALLREGAQPVAVIEAKKLGSVVENHLEQAVGYCIQQGIAYAGVTDGNRWQLYRTFEPVPLADKLVLDVSIADTPSHETALKLLLLWKPNLASGQPVATNEPVFWSDSANDPPAAPPSQAPIPVSSLTDPLPAENPLPRPGEWVLLTAVKPGKGHKHPTSIRFSHGEARPTGSWGHVLAETAEWLVKSGDLRAVDCPIPGLAGFVNSSPIGPRGGQYANHLAVTGGLYVRANLYNFDIIANSCKLLSHFGLNPETVELQFD